MMHTFSYKSGFIHETVERGFHEVSWQRDGVHGTAPSVHAAKLAITREERAEESRRQPEGDKGNFSVHFGYGDKIVTTGTADGRPAVFVQPTDSPGVPGEAAPVDPLDALAPGEWVMTFPTEEHAYAVCAALQGISVETMRERANNQNGEG